MSSDQEYWDMCLLTTWRNSGTLIDAIHKFQDITGRRATDCNLLRFPPYGMPWKITMRVFVADHLSKINKRMWEQTPDKDVLLLRKLKDSKYDTEKDKIRDTELERERQKTYKNKQKIKLERRNYSNRNQATDWNIVK